MSLIYLHCCQQWTGFLCVHAITNTCLASLVIPEMVGRVLYPCHIYLHFSDHWWSRALIHILEKWLLKSFAYILDLELGFVLYFIWFSLIFTFLILSCLEVFLLQILIYYQIYGLQILSSHCLGCLLLLEAACLLLAAQTMK